jgi:uncharacterized membrane protein YfcA
VIALIAGAVTFAFTAILTIAGVGAAFILIPVFIALGVEVHAAMATALLLNAVALAIASVRNARRGFIDYRTGVPILLVAAALSPLGAWASQSLERRTLLSLFVVFLVFAGVMMLRGAPRVRPDHRPATRPVAFGSAVGAVAGFLGGLLGVGGGNIIAPALVTAGMEPRRASATTSFAVVFASFAGFLGHASLSGVDAALVGITAVGAGTGALLGSYLMTDKLKGTQVRTLLAVVLLLLAVKIGWGLLRA